MQLSSIDQKTDSTGSAAAEISIGLGIFSFIVMFSIGSRHGLGLIIPILAGGVVGTVLGVVAAAAAGKRGSRRIAAIAVPVCMIAGGIGGLLLAGPVTAVLIGLSMLGRRSAKAPEFGAAAGQALKVITVGALVFAGLSAAANAQSGRTFYNVCESNGQTFVDFQRESIMVRNLGDDQIEFVADRSDPTAYLAKKVAGLELMEGGKDQFNVDRFYAAKVDDDSFLIMQKGGAFNGFAYFHADKRRADASDKTVRCAYDRLVKFETDVDAYLARKNEIGKQKQAEFDSQTKGVTTEYFRNLRSRRADPVLERGIHAWWRGVGEGDAVEPIFRIAFLQSDYEFTRNDLGVVLRKTVDAAIYVRNNKLKKCFVKWASFGHESLGGGAFDDAVKLWVKQDQVGFGYYNRFLLLPGERKISANYWYEVDCAPFGQ